MFRVRAERILIALVAVSLIAPRYLGADWNTVGGNPGRSSRVDQVGPAGATLLWVTQTQPPSTFYYYGLVSGGNVVAASRIIGPDLATDSVVSAYDLSTGQALWTTALPFDPTSPGWYSRVSAIRNGQVYATRSGSGRTDYLYALDATNGSIIWRSPDRIGEEMLEGLTFAANGDLIVGNPGDLVRINRGDGVPVWRVQRSCPGACAAAVAGDRVYAWEVDFQSARFVSAFDVETGTRLYSGPTITVGGSSPDILLMATAGGSVYAADANSDLVALRDTGTALLEQWRFPIAYAPFSTSGVGPEEAVYTYSRDRRLVRLSPATGAVLNESEPISQDVFFFPRLAMDAVGTIYLTQGNTLRSYNPDLTLRWLEDLGGIHQTGPVLAENGALIIFRGDALMAYQPDVPSWVKGDFNGDGKTDILWRNAVTGDNLVWFMNAFQAPSGAVLPPVHDVDWNVVGTADFDADGRTDILWRNPANGANVAWFLSSTVTGGASLSSVDDQDWSVEATGDFNGDGQPDLVWRNTVTGDDLVWFMNGTTVTAGAVLTPIPDTSWTIGGTGDFNGDGHADLLWRNQSTGDNVVWFMNGTAILGGAVLTPIADVNWVIGAIGDFSGDGKPDIVWRNQVTGYNIVWVMDGANIASGAFIDSVRDPNWRIVGPR